MNAKLILTALYTAALTSSWWAFGCWPTMDDGKGETTCNMLIIPAVFLTLGAMVIVGKWFRDNWDD